MRNSRPDLRAGSVDGVAVRDEAARGRGVGRALIDAVYARARAAGSMCVYWQTQESNKTAMELYDKVAARSGFVVYAKTF
jgi:ribosomal protein S18 acetylase RimI-like enzyme